MLATCPSAPKRRRGRRRGCAPSPACRLVALVEDGRWVHALVQAVIDEVVALVVGLEEEQRHREVLVEGLGTLVLGGLVDLRLGEA